MSRLDAEYDPAEHHDLDRLAAEVVRGDAKPGLYWICGCGTTAPRGESWKTAKGAREAHEKHREQVLT